MSRKEILEGNKLIAEFMGGKFNGYSILNLKENEVWLPYHGVCNYQELKYHSSWDWLMPVVEKVESIKILDYNIRVIIDTTRACILITHFNKGSIKIFYKSIYNDSDDKITKLYKVIVEFIKWYNQNKLNETN